MVELAPIDDLVNIISADQWKILQELYQRRPAVMVGELLAKRERVAPQPERREPRLLKNPPDNPRRGPV